MMRPHRFPRWAAVALAVAAFLLLIRQSTSQQVEGLGSRVVAPVQAGLSALQAETGRFVDTLRRVRALAEENRRLQEENDRLRSEIMRLSEVEVENRDLRSLLDLKERDDTVEFIPARVIGRDVVPYVSALTIDGGRAAGMEEQMAVVTRRGLAGQIVEVHPTTARVLLITDVNSSVSARIQNPESRATGVVRGRVEGGLVMQYIAQNERVQTGDWVITAGMGGIFPEGIIIGQVIQVRRKDVDVYQEALIQPAVEVDKLERVFVIKRPAQPHEAGRGS
ncbi:MAG TPA: rod shape-determining protein MreC [Chloroflexota bacterium]